MEKYITSKIDNETYCKANGQFTRHIKKHNLTYQQYYEKYITGKTELCNCGETKTLYQRTNTYANSCGKPACVGKTVSNTKQNWTDEQRKKDSENKTAYLLSRTEEEKTNHKNKVQQTQRKKYNGKLSTQTDEFKKKTRHTKLKKYGDEFYNNSSQSAKKNRNKTAEEQNNINAKRRKTNKEVHGVENLFMRPDIVSKAMKANAQGKEYTLPSGKIIGIRGYENVALDMLFAQGYSEDQILIDNRKITENELPVFDYLTEERQHRRYYPDFYIPHENKIIEVKSEWWWNGYNRPEYKGRIANNLKKMKAVKDKGYKYEVWLFKNQTEYEIIT